MQKLLGTGEAKLETPFQRARGSDENRSLTKWHKESSNRWGPR